MQSEMWAWLFRRVPVEQHNQLMLLTNSGMEIAVQNVLRIESEFVAIKGRLAGSQDAGRVFFIPYTNLDYFGFQRDVKETEFDAMFGAGQLTQAPPVAPAPIAAPAPEALPAPVPPAELPASTSVSQKTPLPVKSEVLERFRSRIAGAATSPGNGGPRSPDA